MKKSISQAQLENGLYEQIVSHLERESELKGLEAADEMQKNTVAQQATQQNSGKLKPHCHHCKKPGHYRKPGRQLKREKDQVRKSTKSADNSNKNNGNVQTSSSCNNRASTNTNVNNTNIQKDRSRRPVYPPSETCGKTNHSTEKCYFGANAAKRPPPRSRRLEGQNHVQQRNAQSNSDGNAQAAAQTLK